LGETKSDSPKIKVFDRRKFTADGDPLETPQRTPEAVAPATPSEQPQNESEVPTSESNSTSPPPAQPGQPSQKFLELVTMLASQAELLLVGAEDLPAQPSEGQRLIDYLGVLEEKTAGNLSDEEAKVLSSVLYQLRTFYLQRK
jgi:hypothetical protein